jgi:DNA-directed RNA polymerase specialized sigma24 family protein
MRAAGGKEQSKSFATTEWSLVHAATATDSTASGEALESLCRRYWYPVYAEVRFVGHDFETARDLTQGFFAQLLERNALTVADPKRGKFRDFLKASLKNYLSHQGERDRAKKRGGGISTISLDFDDAEKMYALEASPTLTPEQVFDQRWAHAMLQQVLDRLRVEMDRAGSLEQFERLAPFLLGQGEMSSYRDLAIQWGSTEAAIKMAVMRLRRKFGKLLRAEVGQTLGDRRDVNVEIRFLLSTFDT